MQYHSAHPPLYIIWQTLNKVSVYCFPHLYRPFAVRRLAQFDCAAYCVPFRFACAGNSESGMVHSIRLHGFRYVRRRFSRSFVTQHPRAAVLDCWSRAVLYAFLLCVNNSKNVFLWSEAVRPARTFRGSGIRNLFNKWHHPEYLKLKNRQLRPIHCSQHFQSCVPTLLNPLVFADLRGNFIK